MRMPSFVSSNSSGPSVLEGLESRCHLSLTVKLDYRYDTSGFFASQVRRDTLQAALNAVTGRITDSFAAIRPSGGNTWNASFGHPSGGEVVTIVNPAVPADTMIIYPGARVLDGPIGLNAYTNTEDRKGDAAWQKLLDTRGRTASANGIINPLIGTITFGSTADWYDGLSTDGIRPRQFDLYSVAQHELGHILGIGGSRPWVSQLSGDTFTGPAAVAAFGEPVPADFYHWRDDVRIDGQIAGLSAQPFGIRKPLSRLDYAALSDLGLGVNVPPAVLGKYGKFSGYTYDDRNGNNKRDAGEGFAALLFIDANDNGVFNPGETYVNSAANGYFVLNSVSTGTFRLGQFDTTNTRVLKQYARTLVTIRPDQRTTVPDTAYVAGQPLYLSGSVFDDANKNGQRDGYEDARAGVVVYLDNDADGAMDENEPRMPTTLGGTFDFDNVPAGQYRVRVVLPAGTVQTTPNDVTRLDQSGAGFVPWIGVADVATPSASIGGFAFDDKNANGLFDGGDLKTSGKTVFLDLDSDGKLDANEKSTKSAADGSWTFTGLAAGSYKVRRVFPSGYTYSTAPIDVTLAAGQVAGGLGIGSKSSTTPPPINTASLAGVAFNDADKNGRYDVGDTLAPGKTIWLDLDDDGVKDGNEPSVVTASDGGFSFKNLAAGKYRVRRVFSPGYCESTPAAYVTLTGGQTATGVLIGSKLK